VNYTYPTNFLVIMILIALSVRGQLEDQLMPHQQNKTTLQASQIDNKKSPFPDPA